MHIHFQDWTQPALLEQLEARNLPHGDKIIKVFATLEDPRKDTNSPDLTVVSEASWTFKEQQRYTYPDRATYTGSQLEERIAQESIGRIGENTMRALFRFATAEGFAQNAMAQSGINGNEWLIQHPFEIIDGTEKARQNPACERAIHLDIFLPSSLRILYDIVNYNDPRRVLTMATGKDFIAK